MARLSSLLLFLRLWGYLTWTEHAVAYTPLSEETLRALPDPGNDFDINSGAILSPILRPRVSGSDGSTYVQNHIVDFFMTSLPKWDISFQNSTSKTPATGNQDIPFINIIATRDPPWTTPGEVSRLALVAHYDSKLTPHGFIGATDSAAPCAMIMHVARSVDAGLTKKWEKIQAEGLGIEGEGIEDHQGLQLIFLDGEEAFVSWTATDSLYGARSLAADWETSTHPALSTYHTPLSSISLFVLLDLLGAKSPTVPSYFKTTHWAYKKMANLESRLRSLKLFESSPNHPKRRSKSGKGSSNLDESSPEARWREPAFLTEMNKKDGDRWLGGMIEDDHLPFMNRGVEILHLIPTPFPRVWHEMTDDGDHLDSATVSDWAKLTTAFVGEWMDLEGFVDTKAARRLHREDIKDTRKTEL